jgi:hypothetical protein
MSVLPRKGFTMEPPEGFSTARGKRPESHIKRQYPIQRKRTRDRRCEARDSFTSQVQLWKFDDAKNQGLSMGSEKLLFGSAISDTGLVYNSSEEKLGELSFFNFPRSSAYLHTSVSESRPVTHVKRSGSEPMLQNIPFPPRLRHGTHAGVGKVKR